MALLGVAIVSLLGLHARNIRLTAEAQDMTVAGMLASQLVATARTGDFPELGTTDGRFTGDADALGSPDLRYGGSDSERYLWKREVLATALPRLRQVRVSVSLAGDDRPLATLSVVVRGASP